MTDAVIPRVAEHLAALRRLIGELPIEADRRLVRDALRDALDRDAAIGADAGIVANSFSELGTIHRGSAFDVLLVRQRDLGTRHALKTLRPDRAGDPLLRRLLLDEARHQERVRHPGCLALRAVLRLGDGRPALLTDHVPAPTLAAVLRDGALGYEECHALGQRLAEALAAVHGAGLVHGDVSPANVFLPGGRASDAVLFDFGLARPIGEPLRLPDLERGATPGFAAPETEAPDAMARPESDLFSLGRLLAAACRPAERPPLQPIIDALCRERADQRPRCAGRLAQALATCGAKDTTRS